MDHGIVLEVQKLAFSFDTYAGEVQAVRGVDFQIRKGETLGLVGESGCGKSVTAKAITKINPVPPGRFLGGKILFNGNDISQYDDKKTREIRARDIRMIFQDPMTSLNPTMKIGKQIIEGLMKSCKTSKETAKRRAVEMLHLVGIPDSAERFKQFPHQFSGGMRQRAMIALAMAVNPKVLIADEPTTALDVTTQSQILALMKKIQSEFDTGIMLITHDLGVVANIATQVAVMYAGKIMENGPVDDIFHHPSHPYTWGLLQSIPNPELKKKEEMNPIEGVPPDLFAPPPGCPFATRCKYAMTVCKLYYPPEMYVSENHHSHCWLLHEKASTIKKSVSKEEVTSAVR